MTTKKAAVVLCRNNGAGGKTPCLCGFRCRGGGIALAHRKPKKQFMKATIAATLLPALFIFAGTSCAQHSPKTPAVVATAPKAAKGLVTGRVTDGQGRPLGNVTVYAGHTTFYNANVIGKTDADGRYKLDLSVRPGTYIIHGEMTRNHNGAGYKFDLHPEDKTPVNSTESSVRNIVWKRPVNVTATEWDGVGGFVDFMPERGGEEYRDTNDVELTLIPVGPLADGSKGDTVKAKAVNFTAVTGIYNNTGFANVPVGRYKISVRYVPAAGTPVNLLLTLQKKLNWAKEITTDFTQSSLGYQEIAMLVKFP